MSYGDHDLPVSRRIVIPSTPARPAVARKPIDAGTVAHAHRIGGELRNLAAMLFTLGYDDLAAEARELNRKLEDLSE